VIYAKPLPFQEAIDASELKTLLPTSMTTAELAQLSADIRERARFSAQVTLAEQLDVIESGINDVLAGKTNIAVARSAVKQFLGSVGYQPADGTEGELLDFSSDARINLQLTMGIQMAQGYGHWMQGQDFNILDAFPADEFVRDESRIHPRQNWPQRWVDAGGKFYDGRMIALKNDPVWVKLSRFGLPYPPFDFNSGMGLRDVGRSEAMGLGLIDRDTQIKPQKRNFNADLQASPEIKSARLRDLLDASGVGKFNADGVFEYTGPDTGGAQ
jgi:hypothetical protein